MRVLAAMSGGVDSSVAALLLKEAGHDVTGVTMRLFDDSGKAALQSCCGFGPANDARKMAALIGIRYQVVDAASRFKQDVMDDFDAEYRQGRTPNPCIRCNTFLKFGYLFDVARDLGMEYVATGHYARIQQDRLHTALDISKDQTYFLYTLTRPQIARVLFPLGDLTKPEVRALARERGLPVHDKPESQDICFLPKGGYREYLETRGIPVVKGYIFDIEGNVLGEHDGLHRYTVGQRKGLPPLGRPYYTVALDMARNALVVGTREDLLVSELDIDGLSFCGEPVPEGTELSVRLRYRGVLFEGRVLTVAQNRMTLRFGTPADNAAPGQSAVFYRGSEVVGGGLITAKRSPRECGE